MFNAPITTVRKMASFITWSALTTTSYAVVAMNTFNRLTNNQTRRLLSLENPRRHRGGANHRAG
jgi:hypothetical protein